MHVSSLKSASLSPGLCRQCQKRVARRSIVVRAASSDSFEKRFETPIDQGNAKKEVPGAGTGPASQPGSYHIPDYQFQPPSATKYGMDEYGTPKAPSHSGSDGGSEGTGSGGGGGGGGGSGGSGAPSGDDSSGGGAGLARIMTILLALLMSLGGIMGYMKKGSQKSVIAGVTTGAILLAAAHLMGTAASFKVGIRLAFGACVLIAAAMGKRGADTGTLQSKRTNPTKIVVGVTTGYAFAYLLRFGVL